MGLSSNRVCQIVGAMVLALCASAAFTQADESFRIFNKTKDASMARSGRSAVWERGQPPVDRYFPFYAVDPEEEEIRDDRGVNVEYQKLCGVERHRIVPQDLEPDYEFLHPFYYEYTCSAKQNSFIRPNLLQCKYPYECLQRTQEIFVGRRRKGATGKCWDFVPVIIRSGCECMSPGVFNP